LVSHGFSSNLWQQNIPQLTSDKQFRTSHDSAQQPTTFSIKDKLQPAIIIHRFPTQLVVFKYFVAAPTPILNSHLLLGEGNAVPVPTIKAYVGAEIQPQLFSTLSQYGGQ